MKRKEKAGIGSSESFHDTSKHKQKKRVTENIVKMVGQSGIHDKHMQMQTQVKKDRDDDGKKKAATGQTSKLLRCGVCFDFKPDSHMFRKCQCNHPFCTDCISNYVATQIQKNVVNVSCPKPKCSVELKPKHLQPILPKQVIDRWESARYESSLAAWQKTYCPFKDCSVLLVNDGGKVVTISECTSCHRLSCAQCKVPWHAEMNCNEFQKLKSSEIEKDLDKKFFELAKGKMWQKCPTCSIYVESCGGCEHITCRCGRNFCYICGKNWEFGHLCCSPRST